jgi:chorismate-pyruvate lyase
MRRKRGSVFLSEEPKQAFALLFPLDRFYAREDLPMPLAEPLTAQEVPEPYCSLLCGAHDMTPTLEAFHQDRIRLEVRKRWEEGEALWRLVVLHCQEDGRPVEFGAIVIHLSLFPEEAREQVLEGQCPLGTILATHHLYHTSHPQAFFRIQADSMIRNALCVGQNEWLYGRRNYLRTQDGTILADILEILPSEE